MNHSFTPPQRHRVCPSTKQSRSRRIMEDPHGPSRHYPEPLPRPPKPACGWPSTFAGPPMRSTSRSPCRPRRASCGRTSPLSRLAPGGHLPQRGVRRHAGTARPAEGRRRRAGRPLRRAADVPGRPVHPPHPRSGPALRKRGGRPWSHKIVAHVLVNRVYLGGIAFRDIVCADAHDPLIDPATFALAL
jgi:hypothetical protein